VARLIDEARARTMGLQVRQELSDAEAELFWQMLQGPQSASPAPHREDPTLTGHAPSISPEALALYTMSQRVALLEQLATTDTLHPALLCRILRGIAKNLGETQVARRRLVQELERPDAGANLETRRLVDQLSRSVALLEQLLGRLRELEARAAPVPP